MSLPTETLWASTVIWWNSRWSRVTFLTHVRMHTITHARTYACTRAHTHACTHPHTHACACMHVHVFRKHVALCILLYFEAGWMEISGMIGFTSWAAKTPPCFACDGAQGNWHGCSANPDGNPLRQTPFWLKPPLPHLYKSADAVADVLSFFKLS